MKKTIYLIMVLGSLSAFSQKSGIKGGLNIGNEKATQNGISATTTAKLSFMLGLYTESKISDQLYFSPELIYSIDGGQVDAGGVTLKDNFSYLSVPALLKYYPNEKFNLHLGPQIGFLLAAKVKGGSNSADITSSLKRLNFSAALGAEVDLNSVSLGLRAILGLSNIANDSVFGDVEYRLNTFQIYLAVPF